MRPIFCQKVELLSGRKLTPSDYSNFSRVVLLDEGLAQQLFGTENPLNQVVSVGDNNYRVVGIFKDPNAGTALYGASSGGSALMANTQLASEFGTDEIQNYCRLCTGCEANQNRWDRSCSKANRAIRCSPRGIPNL